MSTKEKPVLTRSTEETEVNARKVGISQEDRSISSERTVDKNEELFSVYQPVFDTNKVTKKLNRHLSFASPLLVYNLESGGGNVYIAMSTELPSDADFAEIVLCKSETGCDSAGDIIFGSYFTRRQIQAIMENTIGPEEVQYLENIKLLGRSLG